MTAILPKLPAWHAGETFLQENLGVAERMRELGQRVIRDYMPDQHREFYAQLPFVVLGSVDSDGDAWATLVCGKPGFMASPTPTTLHIAARADEGDPAAAGLRAGQSIGLLGIELHTRRRNRMNGIIAALDDEMRVDVDQSFGNCPRYIQLRDFAFTRDPRERGDAPRVRLDGLDAAARALIETSDTFFVASYADRESRRQVDVSHRGGKPGFVRIDEDGLLTIPDFDGNLFFNTLGNIVHNGKAGLVFVDFRTGDMLQMSGDAAVILDSPEIAAFEGAQRLWTFRPRRVVQSAGALPLRWSVREQGGSPHTLMTGDWRQAATRLRASQPSTRWRPFAVTRIVDESASIRSFHLEPADGQGAPPHIAGQHLPIRVGLPGGARAIRTYTLSVAPSDGGYRISVKRQGTVSQYLHDRIRAGDVIEAGRPAGQFTMSAASDRPAVLLAGGVGITPLLAMLRHSIHEGRRTGHMRPVVLFYAARSKAERPFDAELSELAAASHGALRLVRVLGDTTGAQEGQDYDAAGRIDMALLARRLPFDDCDWFLCGPPPFVQALYNGLRGNGVADSRIHAEAFGPASLVRTPDAPGAPASPDPARPAPAAGPVPVMFLESATESRWTPGSGSLLELAEACGLDPAFGCRTGSCGSCRTRLLKGAITYTKEPTAAVAADEVLLCCAVPAQQDADRAQAVHLAL